MKTRTHLVSCVLSTVLFVGCSDRTTTSGGTGDSASGETGSSTGDGTTGDGSSDGGGTGDSTGGGGPIEVVASGAAQKGPFVLGTTVEARPLDESGNLLGQIFETAIVSDHGDFELSFSAEGAVRLEASGYYYNEMLPQVSAAPLTLRALLDVTAPEASTYINLITHLAYGRAIELMAGGLAVSDAIDQAEAELRTAMAIAPSSVVIDKPGIQLDLEGGDDTNNAYLLAVSAVLAQAAVIRAEATGSVDAAMQELANGIEIDLDPDGELEPELVQELADAVAELDPERPMDFLIRRFEEIGATSIVPNVNRVIDTDGDGLVNLEDNCRWVPNPGQETIDDQMCSLVVHRAGPARTDDDESPRMGAGDLDGDGRAEMIVARGEQATVYSLDQAGVMRVVDEATVTSEGWIRVGDFTGDGHADVAFGEANGSHELGKITVYPGSGSASLGGSSVATDAAACFEGRFVSDVNNDDRDDMLTIAGGDVGSGYWAQDVAVALGQADGSFVVSTMYIGSSAYPTQTPSWVGFGDFDSDGVADLVQVFAGDELLGITPGLGDGTFGTTVASTIPGFISLGCAENCGGVARDGNGDGNIDVVLAGAEAAYVIPGDGAGGIGAPIESLLEGPTYNPHDGPSIVEDFTGDGVPDLLQAHGASDVNRIVYQIGLGSGSFGQGHAFTPAAFADGAPGPTVGDFDGDGHLDLGFVMRPQAEASLFVVLVNP